MTVIEVSGMSTISIADRSDGAVQANSDVLRPGANRFAGNPINAATPTRGGLSPHVVRRVREYVDHNIERRIKVGTLAKLADLSVCYFLRAFKKSVGVTPRDYLARRRVERTVELLSGTDMSISEIALAAGFADQSHCARRFRQHVGMSPLAYRRLAPSREIRFPILSTGEGYQHSGNE